MKKIAIILSFAACIAIICFGYFFGKRGAILKDGAALSEMPVMKGGRLMPLSSAGADILRFIYGKSSVKIGGKWASPTEWLVYINAHKLQASEQKFFSTDNRELQNLLGIKGRYYSYQDFEKKFEEAFKAANAPDASPFAKACRLAIEKIASYEAASNALSFCLEGATPRETFEMWKAMAKQAASEIESAKAQNRKPNSAILADAYQYLKAFREIKSRHDELRNSNILAVANEGEWQTPLDALLDAAPSENKIETFSRYGDIVETVCKNKPEEASIHIKELKDLLKPSFRIKFENFANRLDIFYRGAILYAAAAIILLAGTLLKKYANIAFASGAVFTVCALSMHAFGMLARMYIQMRPPVTNLYSSVIFTGLMAVGICVFLMLKKGKKIYALIAAPVGFLSLVIALNLPYSGDTMGKMAAVLNSNFWLTAHIVPMMLGYCGVFLAGFAASLKLIFNASKLGKVSEESNLETAKTVYAILCFSMVFSFAGTMLGGVWANMSWGRFWGWDPKENGALMVVLWSAFTIHLHAFKYAGARAFLALACIGNIVAAWAWFGVNMLGIGLHSYGFIGAGWLYLAAFVLAQLAIALLAFVKCKNPPENSQPQDFSLSDF